MPKQQFIEFRGITKNFSKNFVLDKINLKIDYGQITGIIGPSGSGKTTLLNMLVGYLKPSKGSILFQSRKLKSDMKFIRQNFGFATEDGSFYPRLTVKENLYYFGRLYNLSKDVIKERAEKIIKLVDLDDAKDRVAEHLSVGMRRRLDIACALVNDPEVLILDEPTEDLDPILRKGILKLLQKIKKRGKTIILTSHLINEIEPVCDKVAVLYDKRIVTIDTPTKLKKTYVKNCLDDVFEEIVKLKGGLPFKEGMLNVNGPITEKIKFHPTILTGKKPFFANFAVAIFLFVMFFALIGFSFTGMATSSLPGDKTNLVYLFPILGISLLAMMLALMAHSHKFKKGKKKVKNVRKKCG